MSEIFSNESKGFDCSAYLGHGLEWPVSERAIDCDWSNANSRDYESDEYCTRSGNKHAINSDTVQDWKSLLQEEMASISKKENSALREEILSVFQEAKFQEKVTTEHYYENEYNSLLKWMDKGEIIVPPPAQFANKREEIQQISLLADKEIGRELNNNTQWQPRVAESYNMYQDPVNGAAINAIELQRNPGWESFDLAWNGYHVKEHSSTCGAGPNQVHINAIGSQSQPHQAMSPRGFQNFLEEQLVGFGESSEKQQDQGKVFRKRRLCRHFVKGLCLRGNSCEFLHDVSFSCSDDQKVFLGGLPTHLTPELLKTKLEEQGLTVLNKPRIMRGFTPQVCVGSVEEAKKLIARRYIFIDEYRIDVRPYHDRDQLRKGLPSIVKRSVFLGGLPDNTTGEIIVADLQRLDVKVVDIPVIKNGFAPRVVLESLKHAKMLVAMKRVIVNGGVVDVRPYVNFRKRY